MIVAAPGPRIAPALEPAAPAAARALAAIPFASTATVLLGYRREDVSHLLEGYGLVIAGRERLRTTALSFVSTKFPFRAPEGHVLLRGFLGGARDGAVLGSRRPGADRDRAPGDEGDARPARRARDDARLPLARGHAPARGRPPRADGRRRGVAAARSLPVRRGRAQHGHPRLDRRRDAGRARRRGGAASETPLGRARARRPAAGDRAARGAAARHARRAGGPGRAGQRRRGLGRLHPGLPLARRLVDAVAAGAGERRLRQRLLHRGRAHPDQRPRDRRRAADPGAPARPGEPLRRDARDGRPRLRPRGAARGRPRLRRRACGRSRSAACPAPARASSPTASRSAAQDVSSTAGIVSRIESRSYVHSGVDSHLVVQTDAAINPGNSGGPVVQDGRVVGVAFQGYPGAENMGFFIPIPIVRHFLDDLKDGRYDGFPDSGLDTMPLLSPALRRERGLPAGRERGRRRAHRTRWHLRRRAAARRRAARRSRASRSRTTARSGSARRASPSSTRSTCCRSASGRGSRSGATAGSCRSRRPPAASRATTASATATASRPAMWSTPASCSWTSTSSC